MHNTAIRRKKASTPMLEAYAGGAVSGRVLDFGCGAGADVAWLKEEGFKVKGYDPHTPQFTKLPRGKFDTVLVTYVANVMQNPFPMLEEAWKTVRKGGRMVVTCRGKTEVDYSAKKGGWLQTGIGWTTSRGSYQRGYTPAMLTDLCKRLCDSTGDSLGLFSNTVNGNPMIVVVKG